jgi:hypothetical protein
VALSGPAPPLDPAYKSPCTPEVVPDPFLLFWKATLGLPNTECWHLFKVQSPTRRYSGGLAKPRRSGYHLSPLQGGATVG